MILRWFPFTVIPLIVVNILFLLSGVSLTGELFHVTMFSGAPWSVSAGDLMVLLGLASLFVEMLRSTMVTEGAMANHMTSVVVLLVYVIEFFLVTKAANSTFFLLSTISLIDVLAGFSITTKVASRDVTYRQDV
jgi:hypothetical protein